MSQALRKLAGTLNRTDTICLFTNQLRKGSASCSAIRRRTSRATGAIFGPESSGKTTLVYHVIAEAQRRGGICAFIDAEHAMDPTYAKRIGINIDNLLVSQPDTGGQRSRSPNC